GSAAVGRDAELGISRREAGVLGRDAEVGDKGERHSGARRRAMHAGEHELRHSPQGRDEGVIVLQQLADHGRDRVAGGRSTDGLQIAARAEGTSFALDHQHPDLVGSLDFGAERLELLRDREIDRVERGGPVQRDGCDRTLDPEQRRVVGRGDGGRSGRHRKIPGLEGDGRYLNRGKGGVTIPAGGGKMRPNGCTRIAARENGRDALMDTMVERAVSSVDPFSHAFLENPYPHHEAMREAGPVVWLERYGIWAMARHQEVRDALTDWQTYCSGAGVGLSDFRKETPWRP